MDNYQLYRTNPRLGGQVAWNMVLENIGGELKVDKFSLSPYSPYASFAYNEDRDWLRYTHQDNVVHLYKLIKGSFYDPCIDSRLSGHYPLLDRIATKNKAEDFGMMRIPYKRYNKQFSILCPVWLENFGPDSDIRFEFVMRPTPIEDKHKKVSFPVDSEGHEIVIASKSLNISHVISEQDKSKHASFENYFHNYISYISQEYLVENESESNSSSSISLIGDSVINLDIHYDEDGTIEYGAVTGLHVASGNVVTQDITSFLPNLYERERPLMETDSLIQSNIANNELIVKQLFNFNFIFNLEDLSNNTMLKLIGDAKLNVDVRVYVDGVQLERRVFDSNYIYIPNNKESSSEKLSAAMIETYKRYKNNALRYLLDTECIDLIKYNKVSQYIHHWSLTDNNDYLFNLYSGFASKYRRDNIGFEIPSGIPSYFYKQSPNYWNTDAKAYPNALNWCSYIDKYEISPVSFKNTISSDTKQFYTDIDLSKSFVGYTKVNKVRYDSVNAIKVTSVSVNLENKALLTELRSAFNNTRDVGIYYVGSNGEKGYVNLQDMDSSYQGPSIDQLLVQANYPILVFLMKAYTERSLLLVTKTDNKDTLTYKYFKDNILPLALRYILTHHTRLNSSDFEAQLEELGYFFDNVIEPMFIYVRNSLNYRRVDSPINTSTEIEYTKDNNSSNTLIRYLGSIKPTFTELGNVLEYSFTYYNDINDKQKRIFELGMKQNYLPYYPSINYWYLSYLNPTADYQRVYRNDFKYLVEDKWYDYSIVLNIEPTISFMLESRFDAQGNYYNLDELIREKLADFYPSIVSDDQAYEYFLSLYDISKDYEYAEDTDGKPILVDNKFKYIYKIKLTLK